jgi:ferredoxin
MYRVNKQKCTGCRVCTQKCPGATRIGDDGKAEVIDQEKLEKCGGESLCPFGAIEKTGEEESETGSPSQSISQNSPPPSSGRGMGRNMGRGMGAGSGRGLSKGPQDGRGRGGGRGGI